MQNKDTINSEYTNYAISEKHFTIPSEELISFYKENFAVDATEKLRLKKLINMAKDNISKSISEANLSFNSMEINLVNDIFTHTKSLHKKLNDLRKSIPSQIDLADIYCKFRDTINALETFMLKLKIKSSKDAKCHAEIIVNLLPILEIFTLSMRKLTTISVAVNIGFANLYLIRNNQLSLIVQQMLTIYQELQKARLSATEKKYLWFDEWNDVQAILFAQNSCSELSILKDLSHYWAFSLDDKHIIRVTKGSMPKFPHLADESHKLSTYEYASTLPDCLKFSDFTNLVVYDSIGNKSLIKEQEVNAYIARDNDPKEIISIIAELLIDSQKDFVKGRIHAIKKHLLDADISLHDIVKNSEQLSLLNLQKAIQSPTKASTNNLQNLILIYQRLSIQHKNQLLIQALQANIPSWVKFCLENGASINATAANGRDLLLLSLSSSPATRGIILDEILKLNITDLNKLKSLNSQELADFIEPEAKNTIIHELILRKKSSLEFFKFFFAKSLSITKFYMHFHKNNKSQTIYELTKSRELKLVIKAQRQQLFLLGLQNNDMEIVKVYVQTGGNVNAVVNKQHPLQIIWKNLANSDDETIDILQLLLIHNCKLTTYIAGDKTLYSAICQKLSSINGVGRFFIDDFKNYKEALKIIIYYKQSTERQTVGEVLKDSLRITWLAGDLKPDLQSFKYNCLILKNAVAKIYHR